MKKINYIFILFSFLLVSCFDSSKPNYQFFPNMYESVGYDTYAESNAFANGIEAQEPVQGTISRGWEPYEYEDSNEGYELAKVNLNRLNRLFSSVIFFLNINRSLGASYQKPYLK